MTPIAKLLLEIATEAKLPDHIWAAAMMYYFAFQEYAGKEDPEDEQKREAKTPTPSDMVTDLILGISSLVLSVKANENFLNSSLPAACMNQRVGTTMDAATRVLLSYTDTVVSVESVVKTKRKLRESVSSAELMILRIVGDALVVNTTFSDPGVRMSRTESLEFYSTPACLNKQIFLS